MTKLLPLVLAFQLGVGGPLVDPNPRPPYPECRGAPCGRPASADDHGRAQGPPLQGLDELARRDRWFAEDKLKHFFASLAATNLAYGAARTAGLEGDVAVAVAAGAAGAAGLWKEFRDRRAGGPFSVKDLVWDALGIGVGVVLAVETRDES